MKNIIVTGGSGTIGTAIVENIIKNGDKAWVIDINEPINRINQEYFNCDIRDYEKLKSYVDEKFSYNNIDAVITVAGGGLKEEWGSFLNTDIKYLRESIDINLIGHINTIHVCAPHMNSTNYDKSITMISSINGKAAYRLAGYSSAKAGLEGFMYGVIKDLAEKHIRINIVSLGTVVTELTLKETKKDWKKLREGTLTGEFVSPIDIANLVNMIMNNKSITGQNIVIDSGQLIKR